MAGWDIRNPAQPVVKYWKHESPVSAIGVKGGGSGFGTFVVGHDDGVVTSWEAAASEDGGEGGASSASSAGGKEGTVSQTELSGLDCEAPVRIIHDSKTMSPIVAGADGSIRYYGSVHA